MANYNYIKEEGLNLKPGDVFGINDVSVIFNLLILNERRVRSNRRAEGTLSFSPDSGSDFKSHQSKQPPLALYQRYLSMIYQTPQWLEYLICLPGPNSANF